MLGLEEVVAKLRGLGRDPGVLAPQSPDDAPSAPGDHASAAEARLLEAFPGASEVAG